MFRLLQERMLQVLMCCSILLATQAKAQTISTSALSTGSLCAGAVVNVPFTVSATFNSGNIFTAQLSDATGSFTASVNIGTLTTTAAGIISATIPLNTPAGTAYRIRVTGSNPGVTGTDNGTNLTINAPVTPSVIINATTNTVCSGTSVTFTPTVVNGGTTPTYVWKNGTTTVGTGATYASTTLANSDVISVTMTSNATCATPASITSNNVTMTVYPAPSVSVSGGGPICPSTTATLTASGANTYSWSAGTTPATGSIVTVAPTVTTTYIVTGTESAHNCTDTGVAVVSINTLNSSPVITPAAAFTCNGIGAKLTTGGSDTVLFSNFNSAPAGWTTDFSVFNWGIVGGGTTGGSGGGTSYVYSFDGSNYYMANGNNGGQQTKYTNLNSPVFSLAGLSSATLTFYSWFDLDPGKDTKVSVDISTDGGNTWTTIYNTPGDSYRGNQYLTLRTIPIPGSYLGQTNVKIRFSYYTTWGYAWAIDQPMIMGVPTKAIWTPVANLYTNSTLTTPYVAGTAVDSVFAAPPNTTKYMATIPGSCGVPDTVEVAVTTVNATAIAKGNTTFCQGGDSTLLAVPKGPGATYQWRKDGVDINGFTDTFYAAKTSGAYKVIVKAGGCIDSSAAFAITAKASPAKPVLNITNAVSLCTGDSATLTTTGVTGYKYQWTQSGLPVLYDTTTTHIAKTNGSYRIVVKNSDGCSDSSAAVTVNVNPLPATTITNAGPTTFCFGGNVLLNGPAGTNYTYQWKVDGTDINGATTDNYMVTATGGYKVVVKNNFGCIDSTSVIPVTVNKVADPTIDTIGVTTFCDGDSVLLKTIGVPNYTYQWRQDSVNIAAGTDSFYKAKTLGNYSVIITDANTSCSDTSINVVVRVNPLPTPAISASGYTVSTGYYDTYQWYVNGKLIPGATSQDYTVVAGGKYTVMVSDFDGCSNTSSPFGFNPFLDPESVGSVNNVADAITVYPNPASGVVHINSDIDVNATLSSMDGKTLLQNRNTKTIDISSLPSGMYLLQLTDTNGQLLKVEKIVKAGW